MVLEPQSEKDDSAHNGFWYNRFGKEDTKVRLTAVTVAYKQ